MAYIELNLGNVFGESEIVARERAIGSEKESVKDGKALEGAYERRRHRKRGGVLKRGEADKKQRLIDAQTDSLLT